MIYMAAMPIYGKNIKKSSSPEPIDQWPWNYVCSIAYVSTTKVKIILLPLTTVSHIWTVTNNQVYSNDVRPLACILR